MSNKQKQWQFSSRIITKHVPAVILFLGYLFHLLIAVLLDWIIYCLQPLTFSFHFELFHFEIWTFSFYFELWPFTFPLYSLALYLPVSPSIKDCSGSSTVVKSCHFRYFPFSLTAIVFFSLCNQNLSTNAWIFLPSCKVVHIYAWVYTPKKNTITHTPTPLHLYLVHYQIRGPFTLHIYPPAKQFIPTCAFVIASVNHTHSNDASSHATHISVETHG